MANRIADLEINVSYKGIKQATDKVTALTTALRELESAAGATSGLVTLSDTIASIQPSASTATKAVKGLGKSVGKASESSKRLSTAVKQASSELEKTKAPAEKASSSIGKLVSQFGRLMKVKIMRLAITQILKGISEGFQNAYIWSLKMGDSFATTVDTLYSALGKLKNQFGSLISELFEAIAPLLMQILTIVTAVIDRLSQFFAWVNGKTTYKKATNNAQSYGASIGAIGDSADSARGSVEKLQRTILGFDELNVLNDAGSSGGRGGSGGGSGGGIGGGDALDLYEYAPIEITEAEQIIGGVVNVANALVTDATLIAEGLTIPIQDAVDPQRGRLPDWLDKLGNNTANKHGWAKDVNDALADASAFMNYTLPNKINEGTATWGDKLKNFFIEPSRQQAETYAILAEAYGNPELAKRYREQAEGMSKLQAQNNAHAKAALANAKVQSTVGKLEGKAYADRLKSGQYWHDQAEKIRDIEASLTDEQFKLWKTTGDLHLAQTGLTYEAEYWQGVVKNTIDKEKTLKDGTSKVSEEYKFWNDKVKNLITNSNTLNNTVGNTKTKIGEVTMATDTATGSMNNFRGKVKSTTSWLDVLNPALTTTQGGMKNTKKETDPAKTSMGGFRSAVKGTANWLGLTNIAMTDTNTKMTTVSKTIDEKAKPSVDNYKTSITNLTNVSISDWKTSMVNAFGSVKNAIDYATASTDVLKRDLDGMSHVNVFTQYGNGKIQVHYYAEGGFPSTGEMFVARENGIPEMVGTIGGRTAVANNTDIVQAISRGVYEAMSSARGEQTTSVNVFMDSVAVAKATQRGNQVLNRSFNMTLA